MENDIADVTNAGIIYDSFVFRGRKIVVLKNEAFDEIDTLQEEGELNEHEKKIMLAELFSCGDSDHIFPLLDQEEYAETLKHYIALKKCFLEVTEDD